MVLIFPVSYLPSYSPPAGNFPSTNVIPGRRSRSRFLADRRDFCFLEWNTRRTQTVRIGIPAAAGFF
jgi:hypothetical protein